MARGKHSSAASYRRMISAEDDVKRLKAELRESERRRAVAERIAARVDAAEMRCKELAANLEIATCEEIARLQDDLHGREEVTYATLDFFIDLITRRDELSFTPEEFTGLQILLGPERWSAWLERISDREGNREKRRARKTNRPGWNRALLRGDLVEQFEKSSYKTGMPLQ